MLVSCTHNLFAFEQLQVWEFNCGREHGERLERTHIPADTRSVWFWDLKRLFGMKLDFKILRGQAMNAIASHVLLTQFFFFHALKHKNSAYHGGLKTSVMHRASVPCSQFWCWHK